MTRLPVTMQEKRKRVLDDGRVVLWRAPCFVDAGDEVGGERRQKPMVIGKGDVNAFRRFFERSNER